MARRKRTSPSIDPALDLGGLTLVAYKAAISTTRTKLEVYNTKLSDLDELLNELETAEGFLDDLSERMLAGVGSQFGKDSDEYEKAGGTRKSERKKPVRKPKP